MKSNFLNKLVGIQFCVKFKFLRPQTQNCQIWRVLLFFIFVITVLGFCLEPMSSDSRSELTWQVRVL